jgi:hypothetical protein
MSETFWEDADGHLKFVVDTAGAVWAHSKISNWNRNVYYKAKAVWEEALDALKERNIPFVFVCIPDNDKKLEKFERMFGFEVLESVSKPGKLFMFRETGV